MNRQKENINQLSVNGKLMDIYGKWIEAKCEGKKWDMNNYKVFVREEKGFIVSDMI